MDRSLPARRRADPIVSFRGVGKTFSSGTEALRDLDLDVFAGEFLSLLGPSGCGKSTALRLIAGLVTPTVGTLARAGIESRRADAAAAKHEVGFVFQEPTLLPWASAEENVTLPLRLLGVSGAEARERATEVLALVGLSGFERAIPRELSGGMKMRVSIARALVTRPRLLLLDEPFAALDEITRTRLNDDLLTLWRDQDLTVVFVTHSVYESVYLSSRIAVLTARPGRVVREVHVDAPTPRSAEFRLSAPYAAACREVSTGLERALAETPSLPEVRA